MLLLWRRRCRLRRLMIRVDIVEWKSERGDIGGIVVVASVSTSMTPRINKIAKLLRRRLFHRLGEKLLRQIIDDDGVGRFGDEHVGDAVSRPDPIVMLKYRVADRVAQRHLAEALATRYVELVRSRIGVPVLEHLARIHIVEGFTIETSVALERRIGRRTTLPVAIVLDGRLEIGARTALVVEQMASIAIDVDGILRIVSYNGFFGRNRLLFH